MSQEYQNWGGGQLLTLHWGESFEMHKSIRRRIWIWDNLPQWTKRLNSMSSTEQLQLVLTKIMSIILVSTYFCLKLSNHRLHKQCREKNTYLRQQFHN